MSRRILISADSWNAAKLRKGKHMASFRPQPHQKPFYDIFEKLCYSRYTWEVWADFVLLFAIAISNTVDTAQAPDREKRYLQTISSYQPHEQALFPQLAAETIITLEHNPEQDFLGSLYMGMKCARHFAKNSGIDGANTPPKCCSALPQKSLNGPTKSPLPASAMISSRKT